MALQTVAQYETLVEHSPDIIALFDEAGVIQYVSPSVEQTLGYDPDELVGEHAFELVHPDEREQVMKSFDRIVDSPGQSTERREHRFRHADGSWIWAESITTNWVDSALDGYVINSRDITRRKEQERELARQRALLKAQQESVLDGILVVDENNEIVSYNERFAELWNVPTEVVEQGDELPALEYATEQLVDPEEFHEKVEHLYENFEESSRDEIELTDGRVFDRYTTPLHGEDDTYYGRLWTFRDITERIEREAELQGQNERLEEFASIVSHDLRNPLNVAQGRVQLALEDCESEHLAAAERALERTFALIDDLLTLAREGASVTDLEPVKLATIVDRCWQHVETQEATLDTITEMAIRADRSRLEQLLENLIRNAVEHGGQDVTITVGDLDDGFYVEDNGPGIPPEVREDVFDSGYSTRPDGTGFGLSIVKQVADAHDWTIEVSAGMNGGARFEITGVEFT